MGQRIHDIPEEDRPRERLLTHGPKSLSNAELLGIFINTGVPGENAVQIGQRLLTECGGLRNLSRRSVTDLQQQKGLGPAKAAVLAAAFEIGQRAAREALREEPLERPELIFDYLGNEMQALNHEEVHILLLNTKLCLIHRERVFQGGLNETVAHPREIMRKVLMHGAFGFVIAHNHPSGDPAPSEADRHFTRTLRDAAALLKVVFCDHVIIGHPSADRVRPYFSFREAGLLQ
jgi:DNA repair protein RadC